MYPNLNTQNAAPRVCTWAWDPPSSSCLDFSGWYDTDGAMAAAFNVIPRNAPLPDVMNSLQANGGLRGYATCVGNRIGTTSNEAKRVVALKMSDQDTANLVSSLQSQPDGFVVYDLKKTEAFSSDQMWNEVTENAPGQELKNLSLSLCYDFRHTADILDQYVKDNTSARKNCGLATYCCTFCSLGLSWLICEGMKKKYRLPNKQRLPRDVGSVYYAGLVLQ